MWCLYRFTRDVNVPRQENLDGDVRALAQAIAQLARGGIWVEATARAGGGIDVWFSLPVPPTDPVLAAAWREHLRERGLAARRITNRA